ncbi:RNA/RNP complex-1-interacting phosphatase [Apus apus]|uniref:RNA/RNP complex-1-interacting phosphatase n=1 Tax=Apus apus TaxID=8895 RepID=UPI0021F8579E|nr:RNA/RNP complex-1-interacting phosphatase [Apus apus]
MVLEARREPRGSVRLREGAGTCPAPDGSLRETCLTGRPPLKAQTLPWLVPPTGSPGRLGLAGLRGGGPRVWGSRALGPGRGVRGRCCGFRWTEYVPLGRRVPGTRFIAFKVPLKKSFEKNLHPEERFSPRDLIKKIREQKEELGLIIDLTYTTRYYGPEELPDTLCYSKILTMGREVPSSQTFSQFKCVVKKFLRDNKDNDKLIGVHCTHGLNRTGYLVCRYLIDVEGMEPNTAIELFNRARGHPIERTNYIQDLQMRSVKKSCGINKLGSGPFREKAGAAVSSQRQVVKHHFQRVEQPPMVLQSPRPAPQRRRRSSKRRDQPREPPPEPGPPEPRGLAARNSRVSSPPGRPHGLSSPRAGKRRRRRTNRPVATE